MDDYYLFYEELRKLPLIKLDGSWLISKYNDARFILEHQDLFSSERNEVLFSKVDMSNPKAVFAKKVFDQWILHKDHDTATLKNAIISNIFSYTKIKMPDYLKWSFDNFRKKKATLEEFDLKTEFAIPVLSGLVMDMLGVKETSLETQYRLIAKHTMNISLLISKLYFDDDDIEPLAKSLLFVIKLGNEFDGADDTFEDMEYTHDYTHDQIRKTVVFSALVHDTANMICNCYYVLYKHKDRFKLKDIKKAIKEANRLESPVQTVSRIAVEDVFIQGQKIPEGESFSVFIGSANRDESVKGLEAGNEFNINRKVQLLTFGRGLHSCVGQYLAEEITRILVLKLLEDKSLHIEKIHWEENLRNYRSMKQFLIKNTQVIF